ncbi:MAG: hypothetical protein AAFX45_02340 [Pseudomonadota bacterium]
MRRRTSIILAGLLIAVLGWQAYLYRFHLRHVPAEMNVWQRLYVSEESRGFGPGGNETGILLYAMPDAARAEIEAAGEAYLESFGPSPWGTLQGRFTDWHATPIDPDVAPWANPDTCPCGVSDRAMISYPRGCPSITGYLARYGFTIRVRADVEALANAALFAEGAYYSFGRTGLIIVIPSEARIIFAYAG